MPAKPCSNASGAVPKYGDDFSYSLKCSRLSVVNNASFIVYFPTGNFLKCAYRMSPLRDEAKRLAVRFTSSLYHAHRLNKKALKLPACNSGAVQSKSDDALS